MSWIDKLFPTKYKGLSVATSRLIERNEAAIFDTGRKAIIKNGYKRNPYVYAVVNKLAGLMAMVEFRVGKVVDMDKAMKYWEMSYEAKNTLEGQKLKAESFEPVPDSRLQYLVDDPNPEQSGYEWRKANYIDKLVTGNLFVEAIKPTESRPPVQLWNLPAGNVDIRETNDYYDKVNHYRFDWGATNKRIDPDLMLHSKYYDPDGSVWGLSPLVAARLATQSINDADKWNAELLQGGAKPEYVITTEQDVGGDQVKAIKEKFKEIGPDEPIVTNAGKTKVHKLGYTMKDMEWQSSQLTNMRKVFDVYGVSGEVFNDPDTKTMANKRDAARSLYTDKVLPEVENFRDELERFLQDWFPEELVITTDTSGIDALAEQEDKIVERNRGRWWLTPNERRESEGYEPLDNEGLDEVMVPASLSGLSGFGDIEFEEPEKMYDFKDNGV